MNIEVLGVGCPKCRATKKLVEGVIRDLHVDTEVVEVSDIDEIIQEQAKRIKKESSLYRVKCKGCGREFISNTEKEYCFEFEEKS